MAAIATLEYYVVPRRLIPTRFPKPTYDKHATDAMKKLLTAIPGRVAKDYSGAPAIALLVLLMGCPDDSNLGPRVNTTAPAAVPSATAKGSAPRPLPTANSAQPLPSSSASSSRPSHRAVPTAPTASPIAQLRAKAEASTNAFSGKPIRLDAVHVRTGTRRLSASSNFGSPRSRIYVLVYVKDGEGEDSTLSCWLKRGAQAPKLDPGDKVTIEGSASFLVDHGRPFTLEVVDCKVTKRLEENGT